MVTRTPAWLVPVGERAPGRTLQLTLDVGHLYCQGEVPIADYILRFGPRIVNVHIEDMRAGVHEHLMFGEGEMDFPPILAALRFLEPALVRLPLGGQYWVMGERGPGAH